ncbi:MAG: hypothetical protein IJS32_08840 [Kiritimatiellae bacterium]|nr:hypothetical protein [Kiritimatiellia bacterium]
MKRMLSWILAAWFAAAPAFPVHAQNAAAAPPAASAAQGNGQNGAGQAPSRYSTDLAKALADGIASIGDDLFPASVAKWLKEKLEKYSEKWTDQAREALIKEACEKLPGDKSKEAFKKLLEDWDTKKDSQTLQADLEGLLKDVVRDEFEAALAKSGLGKEEAETARKVLEDVLTKDLKDIPGAVEGDLKDYVRQKIGKELGKDSADAVIHLYETVTDPDTWNTEDGWDALEKVEEAAGEAIEAITFDALAKIVDGQLAKWGKEHPEVKKWLDALGINGGSVAGTAKNVWGVLTGEGTWSEKFSKLAEDMSSGLNALARNAAKYGLEQLRGWISGIARKWCGKALDWIAGKLREWFGCEIPQEGLKLFQKAIDSLSNKAGKVVVDLGTRATETILGPDPSSPAKQGVPAATEAGQGRGKTLIEGPVK